MDMHRTLTFTLPVFCQKVIQENIAPGTKEGQMNNICGYASSNDDYDDGNIYCQREKNHKGKHRFYCSWETRPQDIKHEHTFEPFTDGNHVYFQNSSWGEDASKPIAKCSFCGKVQWSPPNAIQQTYGRLILNKLPKLEMPDEE